MLDMYFRQLHYLFKKCFHVQVKVSHEIRSFQHSLSSKMKSEERTKHLRNIGIIAHIDAGKTTTTERMLFYSGRTQFIGKVDDGTTVTDYMDQERDRGITITSASISYQWNNHHINLIDTPGHVDFTMEVERSLRVLDSAVAIFDASAGVQAQSLTVWLQADRYNLPRLCYLNKMDKETANLFMCIEDIEKKFNVKTLVTQMPLGKGKAFFGLVDLINMTKLHWESSNNSNGTTSPISDADGEIWEKSLELRSTLVEDLADLDDEVATVVLEKESTHLIPPPILNAALRKVTKNRTGVPVLLGSSYKNIGVQPLMDAICNWLPSPLDVQHPKVDIYAPYFCGVAFKIVHHKRMGPLTFIRIYSGQIEQGESIYNVNKCKGEKINKLFVVYADEFNEVNIADNGSIIVVMGLKITITGDTLVSSETAMKDALEKLKNSGSNESHALLGIKTPEPVFMCSIEAHSPSQQAVLDLALSCLQKEDPSLTMKIEEDTGQIILAGMGELHLSIIKERICSEYKIEVEQGPLQVSYRETLNHYSKHEVQVSKYIGTAKQDMKIILSLEPFSGWDHKKLHFAHTQDNTENLQNISRPKLEAVLRGIHAALLSGPIIHYPVIDVLPKLHWLEVGRKTAETMVSAAASQCIQEILKQSECSLLEPVMKIEIVVSESKSSEIFNELARRRADIKNINYRRNVQIVDCVCPLAELVGFASTIREISSGLAHLSMEFAHYRKMSEEEGLQVVREMAGFSQRK